MFSLTLGSRSKKNLHLFNRTGKFGRQILCLLSALCLAPPVQAARVLTLSPHSTELVFAAGAGDQIVATVQSSDYPPQARNLPRIGDGISTSLEQVMHWKPDLVVGWPSMLMERLKSLGVPVFVSEPRTLSDIPDEIEKLGKLLDSTTFAQQSAQQLRQEIAALTPPETLTTPIGLILMASLDNTYVIGRDLILNEGVTRCGGVNLFADSPMAAPRVNLESIISVGPSLIVTGHAPDHSLQSLAPVLVLDPDQLFRPGPRLIEALKDLCAGIAQQSRAPF